MATVINTPAAPAERESGSGFLLGVILLIVFAVLFFLYGMPLIAQSISGPQISVPDKVDVNVQTPQSGGNGQ